MSKASNEKTNVDSFLSGGDTFLRDDSGSNLTFEKIKLFQGYENKEEKIEVLRKKLKILKGALIKERQAKSLVDQEVGEYRRKHELLYLELDEKVPYPNFIERKSINFERKKLF